MKSSRAVLKSQATEVDVTRYDPTGALRPEAMAEAMKRVCVLCKAAVAKREAYFTVYPPGEPIQFFHTVCFALTKTKPASMDGQLERIDKSTREVAAMEWR